MGELIRMKEYGVITFNSTSDALKAERVMQQAGNFFVVIPTPREISTSCGLSVKVTPGDIKLASQLLRSAGVVVEGVYQIFIEGSNRVVTALDGV